MKSSHTCRLDVGVGLVHTLVSLEDNEYLIATNGIITGYAYKNQGARHSFILHMLTKNTLMTKFGRFSPAIKQKHAKKILILTYINRPSSSYPWPLLSWLTISEYDLGVVKGNIHTYIYVKWIIHLHLLSLCLYHYNQQSTHTTNRNGISC